MMPCLSKELVFPDVEESDENGVVAVGGDLSVKRLLLAYSSGIFPWYGKGDPILWWSPPVRGIIPLDSFHVSRSLCREMNRNRFEIRVNTQFHEVVTACSIRPDGSESGWINEEMIAAYTELHLQGHAHSVETWLDNSLVGGVYGVSYKGLFAGESMFFRISNASKVALWALVERMKESGFLLLDCQMVTNVTESMGAIEIVRSDYMKLLKRALSVNCTF